jgi:ABC-type lipoprotein export system ATPase subunit
MLRSGEAAIDLRGITKSYYLTSGEEVPILKGVTMKVDAGEFVALMGESGSGKTTLLNVIGLLHYPSSGEYLFQGEDLGRVRDDRTLAYVRNRKIGFVFQSFNLIPSISVKQNVVLPSLFMRTGREERHRRADTLLAEVGLQEQAARLPGALSGGQQQRVAIARALINDPDVILADEPTGALDSKTGEQVMEILRGLHDRGKTIVMVTHSAEAAKYADRIVVMSDGRVADKGN